MMHANTAYSTWQCLPHSQAVRETGKAEKEQEAETNKELEKSIATTMSFSALAAALGRQCCCPQKGVSHVLFLLIPCKCTGFPATRAARKGGGGGGEGEGAANQQHCFFFLWPPGFNRSLSSGTCCRSFCSFLLFSTILVMALNISSTLMFSLALVSNS